MSIIGVKLDIMFSILRKKWAAWQKYKSELKEIHKGRFIIVDSIEAILVALVCALIIRHYVIQVSLVPTGSMIPTMMIGDRLFVNKFVYEFRRPERGEIVVFKSPYKDKKDYVKRCIGLPGETISLKKGAVYINGKQLIIPGVDINRDYQFYGPLKIGENEFFMMGDNRGNSLDSRVYGPIQKDQVIGKALFTFWPMGRMQWLH
ncbi:MAG: signal peptidase I [Candidatus Marinamargulisbacteria bacterium]|jgi:signal peptidase I